MQPPTSSARSSHRSRSSRRSAPKAQLERLCAYIREEYPDVALILDAKRGDIGSTAEHYARGGVQQVRRACRHRQPVPRRRLGRCPTSHSGAPSSRCAVPATRAAPTCSRSTAVASRCTCASPAWSPSEWVQHGECGLVVGATFPGELAVVRGVVGDLPILVPGVGAQQGDAAAAVRSGAASDGRGLIVSSSRSILYASSATTSRPPRGPPRSMPAPRSPSLSPCGRPTQRLILTLTR